jgi:DNA-binding transcriptional LysR family regulator
MIRGDVFYDAEAMSMELLQLEYFRVLGRLQHVTRAAERIGIAQPTLSRAIGRLENELGVSLFERRGRSVVLSEQGAAFLTYVERSLDELGNGRTHVAKMSRAEESTIALGFLRTLGPRLVPDLARRFKLEYPAVHFDYGEAGRDGLLERLYSGASTLCITVHTDDARVDWRPIGKQELVVVVPPQHRLAKHKSIALSELANEPFAMFRDGIPVRRQILELLAKAGVKPNVASESAQSGSIFGLVSAGSAVSIVPATGSSHDCVTLAIEDPGAARDIGIACIAGRYLSPAEDAFRSFVLRNTAFDTRAILAAT